jgi:hypothetical protein
MSFFFDLNHQYFTNTTFTLNTYISNFSYPFHFNTTNLIFVIYKFKYKKPKIHSEKLTYFHNNDPKREYSILFYFTSTILANCNFILL